MKTRDRAGIDLINEGDAPEGLLVVLEGLACRYKHLANGERQIVALLLPGDFCDVHAELLREMDHSIGTLSACTMASVPRPEMLAWMRGSANIRCAMDWATLVDEAILREWLVNLGARTAFDRTAHLFCELQARLLTVGIGADGRFPLPLTQEELSQLLGLSVVHMNRVLRRLRLESLATFRGGVVQIHDADRLAAAAGFRGNYLHLKTSKQLSADETPLTGGKALRDLHLKRK